MRPALLLCALLLSVPALAQIDPGLLAGISARSIGPAAMSGRVADVAVAESNPDVVWAGSGEGNPRNSVSAGNGIYKSLNGGRTWKHLGLEKTERIHRVILHPTDPDVAYAAALGKLWGENPERGVFKTTDGGRTWKRVLYVDERTGAAEPPLETPGTSSARSFARFSFYTPPGT